MSKKFTKLHKTNKIENLWVTRFINSFTKIDNGNLTIILPDGNHVYLGSSDTVGPIATLKLNSYNPISKILLKGEVAFAESYMDGEWETPDLTAIFDFFLANERVLEDQTMGSWSSRTLLRLQHIFKRNSKAGSKRNIAYHYDLGNDFYKAWLDDTMTYSSAIFKKGNESLMEAQVNKYNTIAEIADLRKGDNVLEVGCGWGGFTEIAASKHGCKVHGLTLSKQQLNFAKKRFRSSNIDDIATVSFTDYRDSVGFFDKIISIEMFEAVGEENWNAYFQTIYDRLKPAGIAVLQVITIDNERFKAYRKSADFIQRYIFPGGFLPSPQALEEAITRNGLRLECSRFFGSSYARTCSIWKKQFQLAWEEIEQLNYDQSFKRMWEYYLSYCEAGFKAKRVDVGIFKIIKPA